MKRIAKDDWRRVHEIACDIANAAGADDHVLAASRKEELMHVLKELESKYGVCSRITATIADYAEEERKLSLYREALRQARAEEDMENEDMILESIAELEPQKKEPIQPPETTRGK
jgi:hypothetical protein